jgi:probable phosphoglycerate mutase
MPVTLVYLVRHAENDWTGKRLPGWRKGIHLNARGQAQAEALVEAFEGVRLAAIYSSPLERSLETAAPLARARRLKVIRLPGIGELRVGRWEGQPLSRLRRSKQWSVIQRAPSLARLPGGESFAEVQQRMVDALEKICARHPKTAVACFSHADPIKLAIAYYLGLPLDSFQRLSVSPASISLLAVGPDHARLLLLNDGRATSRAGPG